MSINKSKELFYVWITAVSFSTILLIVGTLIFIIITNSIGYFWSKPIELFQLKDNKKILGIVKKTENNLHDKEKIQLKIANRDFYNFDFIWINKDEIIETSKPQNIFLVERSEYGDFYGYLNFNSTKKIDITTQLQIELEQVKKLLAEKKNIEQELNKINTLIKKIDTKNNNSNQVKSEKTSFQKKFAILSDKQEELSQKINKFKIEIQEIGGNKKELLISNIIRFYSPNSLSFLDKIILYLDKLWDFLTGFPREANTEGGIFPIIFGTIVLVILMSIFCYPFGLATAIYLSEYAKNGWLIRLVRIAVSNLAGVPSIVYGIFGLSFFVYGIGGSIDQLFFNENLPNPTFGTGGILWASLTLSILTLPVVIVATEEALNSVPKGIKECSLALGATHSQTIIKVIIPIALPGIITGFILAIARAAGEVAPLLITGVVKSAPALPIDGTFPFVHLDRKFMHLGFHIFDIAFQSPNVEASRPIVFVSTLLLLLIVIFLCSFAIVLRERLRKKYKPQQI